MLSEAGPPPTLCLPSFSPALTRAGGRRGEPGLFSGSWRSGHRPLPTRAFAQAQCPLPTSPLRPRPWSHQRQQQARHGGQAHVRPGGASHSPIRPQVGTAAAAAAAGTVAATESRGERVRRSQGEPGPSVGELRGETGMGVTAWPPGASNPEGQNRSLSPGSSQRGAKEVGGLGRAANECCDSGTGRAWGGGRRRQEEGGGGGKVP